jgi:hypothetical protein
VGRRTWILWGAWVFLLLFLYNNVLKPKNKPNSLVIYKDVTMYAIYKTSF